LQRNGNCDFNLKALLLFFESEVLIWRLSWLSSTNSRGSAAAAMIIRFCGYFLMHVQDEVVPCEILLCFERFHKCRESNFSAFDCML